MKTLLFLAALALATVTARAEDAPAAPATTTVTQQAPAAPPAPPAAPDVANSSAKKEEDEKLTFSQRVKAMAGMLMGKAPADAAAAVDESVVALRTENESLKSQITTLQAKVKALESEMAAADGYLQQLSAWQKGQPAPEAPAAGSRIVSAVQNATSQALQKIGVQTEALEQPKKTDAKLEIPDDPRALMAMHFRQQEALATSN